MATKAAIFGALAVVLGWVIVLVIAPPITDKFSRITRNCEGWMPGEVGYADCVKEHPLPKPSALDIFILSFGALSILLAPAFCLPLAYQKRRQRLGKVVGGLVGIYYAMMVVLTVAASLS